MEIPWISCSRPRTLPSFFISSYVASPRRRDCIPGLHCPQTTLKRDRSTFLSSRTSFRHCLTFLGSRLTLCPFSSSILRKSPNVVPMTVPVAHSSLPGFRNVTRSPTWMLVTELCSRGTIVAWTGGDVSIACTAVLLTRSRSSATSLRRSASVLFACCWLSVSSAIAATNLTSFRYRLLSFNNLFKLNVGRDRSLSLTTDELSGAFNGNKDDYI